MYKFLIDYSDFYFSVYVDRHYFVRLDMWTSRWFKRARLRIFWPGSYSENNGPGWRSGCGFCGDFETRWSRLVITGLVRQARSSRCHCDSYLISVIAGRAACTYGALLETTLIFMHTRVEDTVERRRSRYFRIIFEEDSSRAHLNFLS